MKKITKLVIIVIACFITACACSKKSNSSILIAGISEGNSFISSSQIDIDLSNVYEKRI